MKIQQPQKSHYVPDQHYYCPLCRSEDFHVAFTGADRMYRHPGCFPVCKCNSCGLYFLETKFTIEELGSYYPTTYYAYAGEVACKTGLSVLKVKEIALRDSIERAVLSQYHGYKLNKKTSFLIRLFAYIKKKKFIQIPYYIESGKLLDVGCGGGDFLAKMKQFGWQVEGVEPSQSGAQACRAREITVHEGTLEGANLPSESFDFIRFEHVLEHVSDPISTLNEAKRILTPNGSIRILVPNMNSIPSRWFGTYWYHLDTPRHLYWFTPSTLKILVEKTGLSIQKIDIQVDYSDLSDSLIYWLRDYYPKLGAMIGKRGSLWKVCNKLAWPLRLWMKITRTGTLLIVTLRK